MQAQFIAHTVCYMVSAAHWFAPLCDKTRIPPHQYKRYYQELLHAHV